MSHSIHLSEGAERIFVDSDSVALCATQLPHHPAGTSSERTTSPEYREIGLAGLILHPCDLEILLPWRSGSVSLGFQ